VGVGNITSSRTVVVGSRAGSEAKSVRRFVAWFAWQPDTRMRRVTIAERINRLMELVSGLLGWQSG
jgi:hypothetical protein